MGRKILYLSSIGFFLLVLLIACNDYSPNTGKSNSERGVIYASLEVFPFEQAVKETDLIAEIKVIERLGERNQPSPKTTYKVLINEVIKGDSSLLNETVKVDQQGNSSWVVNDNALFQENEQYILFLNTSVSDKSDYWIQGEEAGMYKVLSNNIAVKMAYPEEELNSIKTTVENIDEFTDVSDLKDYQVLDKELLIKEIKSKR